MFYIVAAIAVGAGAFTAALAHADVDTRFYTLVSSQLFALICGVVLVSSLFTVLYLVGFGTFGRGWIADHFPVFVGWNLLRSHRLVPTLGSRVAAGWFELRTSPTRTAMKRLIVGLCLIGCTFILEWPSIWNLLADSLSPTFARTTQVGVAVLGGVSLFLGGARWMGGEPRSHHPTLRARAAVTLPTFISIVGVSIGIWALVVVLSVMHGFEADLREKILRTNAHIIVEPPEAAGDLGDSLALERAVRDLDGVSEAHAFASGEVMMASTSNIAVNVMVKGMSRDALTHSAQLRSQVSSGDARWVFEPELMLGDRHRYPVSRRRGLLQATDDELEAPSPGSVEILDVHPGILLGSELANSLSVDVGSEIQVISPDGDVGPTGLRPRLRSFRVAGLFTTGMYEYDQKLAYMATEDAQRFFNMGSGLNAMEIRLDQSEDTGPALDAVTALLAGEFSGLKAVDWKTRNKSLFSALALERIVMFIVLGFIILVASLLIVSSLVMLVLEKAR
ncbi:MAG: ABC transporter permease, partial [Myxococcota bacterium]|nr:ABC transporter permease [Myxococcota bacterium]